MAQLGGKSFFQLNPSWETKPVMGLLSQHAKHMYGMPSIILHVLDRCIICITQKLWTQRPRCTLAQVEKPYLNLETDHDGNPLLPDCEDWPKKSMEKKSLIRSYVAVAYRVFNFSCSISSN